MRKRYIASVILVTVFLVLLFLLKQLNLYQTIFSKKGANTLGLTKVIDVSLSGGADRLDYQSIDVNNQRLYISHLGSSTVTGI